MIGVLKRIYLLITYTAYAFLYIISFKHNVLATYPLTSEVIMSCDAQLYLPVRE